METRFAGSQRLDERRRRRLASEADEPDSGPAAEGDVNAPLAAPRGKSRFLNSAEVESAVPDVDLSVPHAVPRVLWKHLLIAIAWAVMGGLILWAGEACRAVAAPRPELSRLVHLGRGTLFAWASGLILLWTAQAAWLIRWVRSRSLNDFGGQYRLWTKVAACWFLFSFCAATGAHRVWSEDVRQVWPASFWQREMLSWLIPAVVLGAGIVWALHREMAGCRLSLGFLQAASVLYLAAAALHLGVPQLLPSHTQFLAGQGTAWAGHVLLALSMQWHLSYVIYRSSDPSPAARRWKIPKPHFALARLKAWSDGRKRAAAEAPVANAAESSASEAKGAKKSARRKKPETQPSDATTEEAIGERKVKPESVKSTSESKPATGSTATTPARSSQVQVAPKIRIDSRHGESSTAKEATTSASTPGKLVKPADVPSPARQEADESRPERPMPQPSAKPQPVTSAAIPAPASKGAAQTSNRAPAHSDADDEDDESVGDSSGSNRPDLRGLSKKQRRRLMQEQRARERGGRDQYADSDDD